MPIYNDTGIGGATVDSASSLGNSLISVMRFATGDGNCIVSGEAAITIDNLSFSGGSLASGTAQIGMSFNVFGGARIRGNATVEMVYLVNGNCIANGSAQVNAIYKTTSFTLGGLVGGKAEITVDKTTEYKFPINCTNEEDVSGSEWTNRTNITTINESYVKTQLNGARSKGLNCYYNFTIPANSFLIGLNAIAYGKWWVSLSRGNQHQLHVFTGQENARMTIGQTSDSCVNPIKNQIIYFGNINDGMDVWLDDPTDLIISSEVNDSTIFGLTYYFESNIDDMCFIDTIKMRVRYRQNLNP